ncbi:peptidoglycan D,D-transpeptidase FtsI family protein [Oceanospirillum linum]|uniref:Peptidoglycan D,D-transpeptidase FtsI n=1 Tax=Oceanospirillum linum TaxID=966 RepID=A0A1T1HFC8_OCELI|nr:penicillin-binding transpeptidase domain-containing protein [Oceanospirillum linum]OOV88430.1 cell division protein [Oceanospirillum linum]SEF56137.1 peptidoglycan synthetase FtsI [Oleiphilus messinensis]SMP05390.1 peptidoglycan synthetase FtsI [Oceanospirillum linum]
MDDRKKSALIGYRYPIALIVLLVAGLLLAGRMVHLHISDREFLQEQGDARSVRTEPIPGYRGMIQDRNGEPLAVSTPVTTLWVNPKHFDASEEQLALLADAIQIPLPKLRARLKSAEGKGFIYLRRHMVPEDANRALALNISGVYGLPEYKRYYPAHEMAAHLIGFTNIDDQGQEGLELAFNEALKGEPGEKRVLKDRRGHVFRDLQILKEPQPGQNIQLTIDLKLQFMAYRELKAAVEQHGAKSGSVVLLDAESGDVLAMVNQPSYNPNDRSSLDLRALRNRALIDLFEPGSPIKPLTVAAAINSGHYKADDVVNTSPGYLRLGNQSIRDFRNYGAMDLTKIITKSSNVGVAKIALSMPIDTVWSFLQQLGLGQGTGIGFPGEAVGTLVAPREGQKAKIATMAYGYGLAVTSLQLAQAYQVLANHGLKKYVSLIKGGDRLPDEQILSASTANRVVEMMETVTLPGGTGTRAVIPGYRVAGKTGTVHKVGSTGYEYEYMAVFAGIAPVSDPKVVAVIWVDSPSGREYHGGEVAAPIFSRIMGNALRYLNVPPDNIAEGTNDDL